MDLETHGAAASRMLIHFLEVVDVTQAALGEAAKRVVARLDFSPGKLNGAAGKTELVLPIVYKP